MKRDESQNVEYKQSWHDEYLKWVCGFANAQGGNSSSGSFRVVLQNLNQRGRSAESSGSDSLEAPKSHETINETINETIKSRPGISRADLIALIGRSRSTVARAVAELIEAGMIERRGSKKTGGYYPRS